MQYREEIKDLFSVSDDYYLAHCISADFGMGKGIVVEFNKRFDMKRKLKEKYPNFLNSFTLMDNIADCILEGRVFNLITKTHYYDKPTYKSLERSLVLMKSLCEDRNIKKIAMPIMGCGLDRLTWDKVSVIIQDVFNDTDIEILVCKQ